MEILDVLKWISSFVLIPTGVVVAFVKLFLDKWLGKRFQKEIDSNRSELEKELVRLRLMIDSELSRSRFVGVKQFDVVSNLWVSIMESYWSAQNVLNPLHQSPDMRYFSTEDRTEYLADVNAPGWLCRKLDESAKIEDFKTMNDDLFQFLQSTKLSDALSKGAVAYRELDKVGILLTIDLYDSYHSFLTLIQDALFEKQSSDQLKLVGSGYNKSRDVFQRDSKALRETLLDSTRAFLMDARAA